MRPGRAPLATGARFSRIPTHTPTALLSLLRLPRGYAYVPVHGGFAAGVGVNGAGGNYDHLAAFEPARKAQRTGGAPAARRGAGVPGSSNGGTRRGGQKLRRHAVIRHASPVAHHHQTNNRPTAYGARAAAPPPHAAVMDDAQRKALDAERRLQVKKRVAELSALVDVLATAVESAQRDQQQNGIAAPAEPVAATVPAGPVVLDPSVMAKLESSRVKRIADVVSRQCLAAIKHLMGHKWAWPFNEPVDASKMGLADYHNVISEPMDLGTIRQRIEAQAASTGGGSCAGTESYVYSHPDAVLAHARLVFTNAKRYNPPGSDVHIMACTLAEALEGRWTTTVAPKLADAHASIQSDLEKATAKAAAAQQARLQVHGECTAGELERRVVAAEAALQEAKAALASLCTPLTPDERRALATGMRDMDPHSLGDAVAVVASAAGVDPADVPDVVDIDLESGDPLMLRRLLTFVATAPKKPSVAAAEARKAAALAAQETQRAARAAAAAATRQRRAARLKATGAGSGGGARRRGGRSTTAARARQRAKMREEAAGKAAALSEGARQGNDEEGSEDDEGEDGDAADGDEDAAPADGEDEQDEEEDQEAADMDAGP